MAPHLSRRRAARSAKARRPFHDARNAHPQRRRNRADGLARHHPRNRAITKIQGNKAWSRLGHPCWPPIQPQLESEKSRFGNPSRFTQNSSRSSRRDAALCNLSPSASAWPAGRVLSFPDRHRGSCARRDPARPPSPARSKAPDAGVSPNLNWPPSFPRLLLSCGGPGRIKHWLIEDSH